MAKAWLAPRDRAADAFLPHVLLAQRENGVADWRKRICDHIAYALLAYTGLQILLTMLALHLERAGFLPYIALLVLVGVVIPACRQMERRWTRLSDAEVAEDGREVAYRRDRALIWSGALGLPLLLTAMFSLIGQAIG